MENISIPLYKFNILAIKFMRAYKNWPSYFFHKLKKQNSGFTFVLRNGVKIKARKGTNDKQVINEVCVLKVYSNTAIKLKKHSKIIDIGAHVGSFSLLMFSSYSEACTIYSYEPEPNNFQALHENIELNNANNIKIFQRAVCKKAGEIEFYLNDRNLGYHNIFRPTNKVISVKSTTLKEIFDDNNLLNCHLLKLDCEGAEWEILITCPDEYFKKINYIVSEIHENLGNYKLTNLVAFLKTKQFDIIAVKKIKGVGDLIFAKNRMCS